MNRFVLSLITFVAVFPLMVGCTQKTSESNRLKIGFILSTMQEERYQKDRKHFEERAAELGVDVLFASSENSESTQLAKVENILSQGAKVLVIQPVHSKAAATFVDMAHREGAKVVAYDRVIENPKLDLYVTMDSFEVGRLQAEAALKAINSKGNVIVLQGEAGHSVAAEITRGVMETLAKAPDVKVIVNQAHAAWSGEAAMKTVENALTTYRNQVHAVIANNSGMANGAVQALREQKLTGKVFVAGADADLTSMKNIVQGDQQFEVLKSIKPLADAAAEAAVALAKGEATAAAARVVIGEQQVPAIHTPVFGVTRENLEAVVIGSGFHSRDEIFGAR